MLSKGRSHHRKTDGLWERKVENLWTACVQADQHSYCCKDHFDQTWETGWSVRRPFRVLQWHLELKQHLEDLVMILKEHIWFSVGLVAIVKPGSHNISYICSKQSTVLYWQIHLSVAGERIDSYNENNDFKCLMRLYCVNLLCCSFSHVGPSHVSMHISVDVPCKWVVKQISVHFECSCFLLHFF